MTPEHYLEYLSLNTILNDYMSCGELTMNRPDVCDMWLADNTPHKLLLNKLKRRVTELQKELLKDYLCD